MPFALVSAAFLALTAPIQAQTELGKALKDIEVAPHWIYDDFPAALSQAKQSGKPVLVVLRCIPCPPGRELDLQVMQPDEELANLEKKFVCVRLIQANGLDLRLFQYDYDMSWVALIMNADQTIYGRYGTRTSSGPTSDAHLSRASFHRALERALELHRAYPGNRDQLAGKTGPLPDFLDPRQIPGLQDRPPVATTRQNCIHCHMVRDFALRAKWEQGRLTPADMWVHPMPENIGLTIDSNDGRRVTAVVSGSPAAAAGLAAGDELLSLNAQPLISLADIQWALHVAPQVSQLPVTVARNGKTVNSTITLGGDWKKSDIAWRPSSWYGLRQGVKFEPLSSADKQQRGIPNDGLALVIKLLSGRGGPKVQAAGLLLGDIIVAVDGKTESMTESEFLASLRLDHGPRDSVKLLVLRGETRRELTVRMW